MKRRSTIAAAAFSLLFLFGGAAALGQGTEDLIGIYTAPDGTGVSHMDAIVGPIYTVYVCVDNGSRLAGISGWELTISHSYNVVPHGWDIQGTNPLNIGSPPDFMVGLQYPLPYADPNCILIFDFFVTDTNPAWFSVDPCPWPSIPDHPVYADGADPGIVVALDWYSGGDAYPDFQINTFSDPLETETFAMSRGEGTLANFFLDAGPSYAFRDYFLLMTASGTSPGTNLPGGATLPLNYDRVMSYLIANYNGSSFTGFRDQFDANGQAVATIFKDGTIPLPVGTILNLAYTTENPYDFQSNPIDVVIVP